MAANSQSRNRRSSSWLSSLLGATFLIVGGFLLGLVVGVVKEDPELVIGHFAGQGEEIHWSEQDPGIVGQPEIRTETFVADEVIAVDVAAAPEPALPAVSAPPALSVAGFAIQVGAFTEGETANRVALGLRDKGFPVYVIEPVADEGDNRWRVRVGPVPTREEAVGVANRLKIEEKLPTWVLSEGGS